MILFFGNNSTLERARNKSRGVSKTSGNSLCDQIDLLEAWKIGSKDGNLTLKFLNKIEKSQSFFFFNGFPSPVSDGGF